MSKGTFETWQAFQRLGRAERRTVVQAVILLTFTWASLRVMDFRRTQKALAWLNPSRKRNESEGDARENISTARALAPDTALEIAQWQAASARHMFFRPTCLENSIALWALLRWRGIHADLRLGARKDAGRFDAHAWLECDGVVLGGSLGDLHTYVPFDGLSASMETQRR
jgi:hypothetical protein